MIHRKRMGLMIQEGPVATLFELSQFYNRGDSELSELSPTSPSGSLWD